MHFGLEMLAKSTGLNMLPLSTSADRVHGFAAGVGAIAPARDVVEYYLINKFQVAMPVTVHGVTAAVSAVDSMVDTVDHWGTIASSRNVTCSTSANTCSFTLPPVSFSRIY